MKPAAAFVLLTLPLWLASAASGVYVADGEWLKRVPERDHARVNPYQGQDDAVAAGALIYADHCAHCHGKSAEGSSKRPTLKSDRVEHEATDGDLYWLLSNGNMKKGMPPWSKLPDQQRWQVIAYLKSLHG
jgi:mono/diheme cytochrome c family protein